MKTNSYIISVGLLSGRKLYFEQWIPQTIIYCTNPERACKFATKKEAEKSAKQNDIRDYEIEEMGL